MLSRRALGLLVALTTFLCALAPTAALAAGGSAADSSTSASSTTTATKTAHATMGVKTAPATLSPTAPSSIVSNPQQTESLPMTGLNVEAVAFVGLLLVAGGLTLRWRIARR